MIILTWRGWKWWGQLVSQPNINPQDDSSYSSTKSLGIMICVNPLNPRHILCQKFLKQDWKSLEPLVIHHHLTHWIKSNFLNLSMGAFAKIRCKRSRIFKRKMMIFHAPCTWGWHDLPRKAMMFSWNGNWCNCTSKRGQEGAKDAKTLTHH